MSGATIADRLSEVLRGEPDRLRLAPAFRQRLEDGLATSLAGTAIRAADLPGGIPALNRPDAILLDRAVLDGATADSLALVLAHEAVHAAQRVAPGPGRLDPERDAAEGAVAVLAGRRHRVRARLAPTTAAAWGEDGHYYTCYVVGLMAGVDPEAARLRALFCQMPDEVHEFDATSAFWDMRRVSPPDEDDMRYDRASVSTRLYPGPHGNTAFVQVENPTYTRRRKSHDLAIQAGLHCLTGEKAMLERARRTATFQSIGQADHLTYGLALHAYGDSFAHMRVSDLGPGTAGMYRPGVGHGHDLHEPDLLGGRVNLYGHYVAGLYDRFRAGATSAAPYRRDEVVRGLMGCAAKAGRPEWWDKVRDGPRTDKGCVILRDYAAALPQRIALHPYRPENVAATEWQHWWPTHAASLRRVRPNRTMRQVYDEIAQIALRWAPPALRVYDPKKVDMDLW
jgi:hypothetical protein